METLCINPRCPKPENDEKHLFCQSCGSELLLAGRYRVISSIGEGGFGQTFEVTIAHQSQTKVLKVLTNPQPKAVELFQREAEVLNTLRHPGIPHVEDNAYFTYFPRNSQEPIHCLVMDKIEGMNLESYMEHREYRPIDNDMASHWLLEMLGILAAVHDQQFFHRDIKPANIMLKPDGSLALVDFGTVRQISGTYMAKQKQGHVTGVISAGYSAPEQLNGRSVLQSDFYSLARSFVFLLTGQEPSELYNPLQDQLDWREHASASLAPQLADLLDRMMMRSPGDRPQNVTEILKILDPTPPQAGSSIDATEVLDPRFMETVVTRKTPPDSAASQDNQPNWPLTEQAQQPQPFIPQSSEGYPPNTNTSGVPATEVSSPSNPAEIRPSTITKPQLFLQWLLASFLAMFISNTTLFNEFVLSLPEGSPFFPLWVGYGLCMGVFQWIILRKLFQPSWSWILATALPFTLWDILDNLTAEYLLKVGILATIMGLAQFFVVRKKIDYPLFWIPANTLALFIAEFAGDKYFNSVSEEWSVATVLVFSLIISATFSVLSSISSLLLWPRSK